MQKICLDNLRRTQMRQLRMIQPRTQRVSRTWIITVTNFREWLCHAGVHMHVNNVSVCVHNYVNILMQTPPGDEMSEVVSCCFSHRHLWVSNLSCVSMQWLEVDSNLKPSSYRAENILLHHRAPFSQNCAFL